MAKTAKPENPFKLVLGKHRITYVSVKEPRMFDDKGDAKYQITILIPYDHPDVERIRGVIDALYKENAQSKFNGLPKASPKLWDPLRDGEEWLAEHPEAEEYRGCYFLKASSKSQPAVFDVDGQDIIDLDEVYSGCYVRSVIGGYAYNNQSKGYGFFLNSIKKMEDGERLGGGGAASHDDYEDEAPTRPAASRPTAPKPAAKPKRIFDTDEDGNEIYSDDNGENWFFV